VDEKPLFCTTHFCVDDVTFAPLAARNNDASTTDQMWVAVSDCLLSEQAPGAGAVVHVKKTGEIELIPAGPARRWTNTGSAPSHFVVVSFR
jgi:hypothetical protein